MPFCSQCGNQVGPADAFCGRCGSPQPIADGAAFAPRTARPGDPLGSFSPRTASILCYIPGLGWIGSIIVLASDKFRQDRTVRFHAFQGLYLFVAWMMNEWVLRPMLLGHVRMPLYHLVQAAIIGMSIFMMVKASHNQAYALPLFGELANRSVSED
jgi:uncharacterized membrane protein